MLITCSSCNSKYLVNSADLKPNGRMVRCAKCGFDWFQSPDFLEEKKESLSSSVSDISEKYVNEKIDNKSDSAVSNLPSTYVMNKKPSVTNTLLLIFVFVFVVIFFWIIKNEKENVIALTDFYIHEFYFNLKLIIKDFTKIVHRILN